MGEGRRRQDQVEQLLLDRDELPPQPHILGEFVYGQVVLFVYFPDLLLMGLHFRSAGRNLEWNCRFCEQKRVYLGCGGQGMRWEDIPVDPGGLQVLISLEMIVAIIICCLFLLPAYFVLVRFGRQLLQNLLHFPPFFYGVQLLSLS